jgi:hypothetical protein
MELRLAIILDRTGRIAQTAVLADEPADRADGHRVLQLIEPELAVFAERVRRCLAADQRAH